MTHTRIIEILVGVIICGLAYFYVKLDQRLDGQAEHLAKLEKNFTYLVGVLNTKMPGVNLPVAVYLSASKNIPPEKFINAMTLLQKDPSQAKEYMEHQLYFNAKEIDAVMNPAKEEHLGRRFKVFHFR